MIGDSEAVSKLNVPPGLTVSSGSKIMSEQSFAQTARPSYAAAFRCIGASCEDPCCGGWDIPVDKATYGRYQQFPFEKLGSLVSQFVSINTPTQPDGLYAQIYRRPSGSCPFFGSDHLCGVQKEY